MASFVIVHLIDWRFPDDYVFSAAEWPLHITFVLPFSTMLGAAEAATKLAKGLEAQSPFQVTAGNDDMFGRHKNIPVTLINQSVELTNLHMALLKRFTSASVEFREVHFVGKGFRAHATIQKIGRAHEGQVINIDNLSLVDMRPDGDTSKRRMLRTVEFLSETG